MVTAVSRYAAFLVLLGAFGMAWGMAFLAFSLAHKRTAIPRSSLCYK
jgi:hypothetical protein